MTHKPWKQPLVFGGNPDHVTLGLGWGKSYVRWGTTIMHMGGSVTRRVFCDISGLGSGMHSSSNTM